MNVLRKYVAVKDFSKARKIFESIIQKIIYDRLQKKAIKKNNDENKIRSTSNWKDLRAIMNNDDRNE